MNRLRRLACDEAGMTLVELMIATALLGLVVAAVDMSIGFVQSDSAQVAQQTQAIDQLQSAEELLTRDIHAATSWVNPPTATSLDFVASLSPNSATINATISGNTLSVTSTVNGTTTQVANLSNLDATPGDSTFSPSVCQVTLGANTVSYYVAVGVNLTVDTPRPNAPQLTRTTFSDSHVEAWNVLYAYQVAKGQTGATGTC